MTEEDIKRPKNEVSDDCPGCVDGCIFLCRFRDPPETEQIQQIVVQPPTAFQFPTHDRQSQASFLSPVLPDEVFPAKTLNRTATAPVKNGRSTSSTVTLNMLDQLVDHLRRPRGSGSVTILREASPKFAAPALARHEYNALVTPTGYFFSFLVRRTHLGDCFRPCPPFSRNST